MSNKTTIQFKLERDEKATYERLVKELGYRSLSAFIRIAIVQKLRRDSQIWGENGGIKGVKEGEGVE